MTFLHRTLGLALLMAAVFAPAPAPAGDAFEGLPGRWTGQGRLGFKDGKMETVTCRATYFLSDDKKELKQNIRCASPSGKIEVKSALTNTDGKLTGKWDELMYNLSGDIAGEVTPRGYKIDVTSGDLAAHMEIIVRDAKQIIEINFNSATLIGMTLMLNKG